MEIRTIGVAGAGTMGSGIAEVAAVAGCQVLVFDPVASQVERGRHTIETSLGKAVARGKLSDADRDGALARIRRVDSPADFVACDFLIEEIVEDPTAKAELHSALGKILRP